MAAGCVCRNAADDFVYHGYFHLAGKQKGGIMYHGHTQAETLKVDLQGLENQGLSIWLGGRQEPDAEMAADHVSEPVSYIRDCVFSSGE